MCAESSTDSDKNSFAQVAAAAVGDAENRVRQNAAESRKNRRREIKRTFSLFPLFQRAGVWYTVVGL